MTQQRYGIPDVPLDIGRNLDQERELVLGRVPVYRDLGLAAGRAAVLVRGLVPAHARNVLVLVPVPVLVLEGTGEIALSRHREVEKVFML